MLRISKYDVLLYAQRFGESILSFTISLMLRDLQLRHRFLRKKLWLPFLGSFFTARKIESVHVLF